MNAGHRLMRISLAFVNSPRRESGLEGVVSLVPNVDNPFVSNVDIVNNNNKIVVSTKCVIVN